MSLPYQQELNDRKVLVLHQAHQVHHIQKLTIVAIVVTLIKVEAIQQQCVLLIELMMKIQSGIHIAHTLVQVIVLEKNVGNIFISRI